MFSCYTVRIGGYVSNARENLKIIRLLIIKKCELCKSVSIYDARKYIQTRDYAVTVPVQFKVSY